MSCTAFVVCGVPKQENVLSFFREQDFLNCNTFNTSALVVQYVSEGRKINYVKEFGGRTCSPANIQADPGRNSLDKIHKLMWFFKIETIILAVGLESGSSSRQLSTSHAILAGASDGVLLMRYSFYHVIDHRMHNKEETRVWRIALKHRWIWKTSRDQQYTGEGGRGRGG